MNTNNYKTNNRLIKKVAIVFAIFGLTQGVFAVDGTMNGGGSKTSKKVFSSIKKDLNFSIHSGFNISNKSFGYRKTGKGSVINTMISYQKGNVTYFMPYKHKPILQKFKTPSVPAIR